MTDAFSYMIGSLCEACPTFAKALSEAADEMAASYQAYLERLRHKRNARPFTERLIWRLINRRSHTKTTKHPINIKQPRKRTHEKHLLETLIETPLALIIPQEVTM